MAIKAGLCLLEIVKQKDGRIGRSASETENAISGAEYPAKGTEHLLQSHEDMSD
jgi:hypothetical protein